MHPSPEKQLTWGLSGGSGYLKLREIGERNLLNLRPKSTCAGYLSVEEVALFTLGHQ
jgi:hypothetical protein